MGQTCEVVEVSEIDVMRERIRDELAGWIIGSGYYSTTVNVDEAGEMADAVIAALGLTAFWGSR